MLTFSFPKIELRGPREKLVMLSTVLGNRVCVAVGLPWLGRCHFKAVSCSM